MPRAQSSYQMLLTSTVRSVNLIMPKNTNLSPTKREGLTGEYWSEVRKKTTEGQYSSVRLELSRLVSSYIYVSYIWHSGLGCLEVAVFRKQTNTQLMIVSMETVHMAKRTNQNVRIYIKTTLPFNNNFNQI